MPRETSLTNRILTYAKSEGLYALKLHGGLYGTSGLPDILVLIPGKPHVVPLLIEVKQAGKVPRPLQKKRLRDLERAGAVAIWADNLETVKEVISHIREGTV